MMGILRSDALGRFSAAFVAALALIACASGSVVTRPDSYVNAKRGYEIARPDTEVSSWRRMKFKGADLAFRRDLGGGRVSTMALISECGRPQASADTLARHLLIGLGERERVGAGEVLVSGTRAWQQTFETIEGDDRIRIKSVTLASGRCTFDFILVSPGTFGETEQQFDSWWSTFAHSPDSVADKPQKGGTS